MDKSESKLLPCAHLVRTTDGKTTQCDVCGAVGDVINPNWEPRWRDAPTSADSQEREAELPPLPTHAGRMPWKGLHFGKPGYTAEQMREYARAALAAPNSSKSSSSSAPKQHHINGAVEMVAALKQPTLTDDQITAIYRATFPSGPYIITDDVRKFARAVLAAAQGESK